MTLNSNIVRKGQFWLNKLFDKKSKNWWETSTLEVKTPIIVVLEWRKRNRSVNPLRPVLMVDFFTIVSMNFHKASLSLCAGYHDDSNNLDRNWNGLALVKSISHQQGICLQGRRWSGAAGGGGGGWQRIIHGRWGWLILHWQVLRWQVLFRQEWQVFLRQGW